MGMGKAMTADFEEMGMREKKGTEGIRRRELREKHGGVPINTRKSIADD